MDFTAEQLPDTFTVEMDGKNVFLRDVPFVKEAKDLGGLIKTGFDAHREVGSRVRVPGKDVSPADRSAFMKRLHDSGFMAAPPASPDDYKITRPEALTEGLGWSDEWAKEFATTLHKHGASPDLAKELVELHTKVMSGSRASLKTALDAGIAALKQEHGDKYEERFAAAGRLAGEIFKSPEELEFFESLGLGNHPAFLGVMMRLAPLAAQDSSASVAAASTGPTSGATADEVRAEVARIMGDKAHPMHEGYLRNDPRVSQHIDGLYRKAYGDGKVVLT